MSAPSRTSRVSLIHRAHRAETLAALKEARDQANGTAAQSHVETVKLKPVHVLPKKVEAPKEEPPKGLLVPRKRHKIGPGYLKAVREELGISPGKMGVLLGPSVSPRTRISQLNPTSPSAIRSWESGARPVPQWARKRLKAVVQFCETHTRLPTADDLPHIRPQTRSPLAQEFLDTLNRQYLTQSSLPRQKSDRYSNEYFHQWINGHRAKLSPKQEAAIREWIDETKQRPPLPTLPLIQAALADYISRHGLKYATEALGVGMAGIKGTLRLSAPTPRTRPTLRKLATHPLLFPPDAPESAPEPRQSEIAPLSVSEPPLGLVRPDELPAIEPTHTLGSTAPATEALDAEAISDRLEEVIAATQRQQRTTAWLIATSASAVAVALGLTMAYLSQ